MNSTTMPLPLSSDTLFISVPTGSHARLVAKRSEKALLDPNPACRATRSIGQPRPRKPFGRSICCCRKYFAGVVYRSFFTADERPPRNREFSRELGNPRGGRSSEARPEVPVDLSFRSSVDFRKWCSCNPRIPGCNYSASCFVRAHGRVFSIRKSQFINRSAWG